MILNDELNEEIEELKKELEEYSNELDKLYSSDNTKSQKMIKTIEELEQKIHILEIEKKELEQKIDTIEKRKNSINNELAHAVHIIPKKYPEKLKIFEESKKSEFKESEESDKNYFNFFYESGIHKYTNIKYDFNGFDKTRFT